MRKILIYVLLPLFWIGCTSYRFETSNEQRVYQNGKSVSIHKDENMLILAYLEHGASVQPYNDSKILVLSTLLQNDSKEIVEFNPTNIGVEGYNEQGITTKLEVLSPEKYIRKLKITNAIAGGLMALNAGIQAGQATTDADRVANEINTIRAENQIENMNRQVNAAEIGILKQHSLLPNQQIAGNILIKLNKEFVSKVKVKMNYLDHEYVLIFDRISK